MKVISDIYTQYKTPPNLQMHMFHVASVAVMICDNFTEPIPKEKIITACLLHDMGNIIKYDMGYFPALLEPEGAEYWQKVKDEYIAKYGEDEHHANVEISKELSSYSDVISWVGGNKFSLICKHFESDDMAMKIIHYADGRVTPHGILSYDERMAEARKRYQSREHLPQEEENFLRLVACGGNIEKQIFAKCKIKPEDINDESTKDIIKSLKNFVIK